MQHCTCDEIANILYSKILERNASKNPKNIKKEIKHTSDISTTHSFR